MTTYVDTQTSQTADADMPSTNALRHLIHFSMETAERLADAAAQIETRGFKLLLKAMAERHARYARELAAHVQKVDADVSAPAEAVDEVESGFTTIQTSMTVPREGRQDILLGELVAEERALLGKYDDAIDANPPSPIDDMLVAQKARLTAAYDNMRRVADGRCELVARLYDDRQAGERAVSSLHAQGVVETDIDVMEGEQIRATVQDTPSMPKTMPTVVAGAISGGVVGLIIGVAWWFLLVAGADAADATVARPITVGPIILIGSSIVFAAIMGAAFGWIIGRNKAEDDAFVTQQGLHEGSVLVAVYVDNDRVDEVENTLRVHHGRELPA